MGVILISRLAGPRGRMTSSCALGQPWAEAEVGNILDFRMRVPNAYLSFIDR